MHSFFLSISRVTQFVIVFLALIILTLRVAYYELDEVLYDPSKPETASSCCCGKSTKEEELQDD